VDHTICTALAPELVRTVRTYATDEDYEPPTARGRAATDSGERTRPRGARPPTIMASAARRMEAGDHGVRRATPERL